MLWLSFVLVLCLVLNLVVNVLSYTGYLINLLLLAIHTDGTVFTYICRVIAFIDNGWDKKIDPDPSNKVMFCLKDEVVWIKAWCYHI